MSITIKPLSPEILNDYLYFFDHITFQENPDWSKCYCYSFHFTGTDDQWIKEKNRETVIEMINNGELTGYLAFSGDKPVGWCNVNNRLNYQRLMTYYDLIDNPNDKVCSIVCFLIHPDFRRHGIAQKLLSKIIENYSKKDFDYIESYPGKGHYSCEGHYRGPFELYQKNGFTIHKEKDDYYIMRKEL